MTTIVQDQFAIEVKKRLIERGMTIKGLAKRLNLHRNSVSVAIHGKGLPAVRKRVAQELDLPYER